MSRVVVTRHDNGEEHITAGHDRPLNYFFVDIYDEEGEKVGGIGLLGDRPCKGPHDAADYVREHTDEGTAERVADLLVEHARLEYPASNVVVDLSGVAPA